MAKKTKLKTLRLQETTVEGIQKLADRENRSFTNMIELILQDTIKYADLIIGLK